MDVMTVKEAAARMKVSAARLNKLRAEGSGPKYVRMGKSVRYRGEDLEAYMASLIVNPAKGAK